MNNFFSYDVVEKIKFISFDDEQKTINQNQTKANNVVISKYRDKIKNVRNEKIKKSLTELTKVFKEK